MERLFGAYPDLAYANALRERRLPPNIEVSEFFSWRVDGSPCRSHNKVTFRPTTRMRRGTSSNAASMSLRNSWQSASSTGKRATV